jgi:hypothetical protein
LLIFFTKNRVRKSINRAYPVVTLSEPEQLG